MPLAIVASFSCGLCTRGTCFISFSFLRLEIVWFSLGAPRAESWNSLSAILSRTFKGDAASGLAVSSSRSTGHDCHVVTRNKSKQRTSLSSTPSLRYRLPKSTPEQIRENGKVDRGKIWRSISSFGKNFEGLQ